VYLREIGFSILLIGVLEGMVNFTAGVSKGFFGKISDEKGLRLPFIKWGYFLSAVSKPLLSFFQNPIWVFFTRTTDRLGKGLRTAPRDALLSQNATPETKARVFSFHRGIDTAGAAIGPTLALVFLISHPHQYQLIFLLAFIPGLISVLLIFFLKEERKPESTLGKGNFISFFRYWNIASKDYKRLVTGLLFLALFNSSDVFLLLKAKMVTGNDTTTIMAYILYNVVYAIGSYPLGSLADKIGIKRVFIGGICLFTIVYFLFGIVSNITVLYTSFIIYGLYAAATEGITKAWITNIAHGQNTATAVGFYTSCESICTLLASIIAGIIWSFYGSAVTFFITASASLLVAIYFGFRSIQNPMEKISP
ncbi:MAG: MFS transporter, partial [Flavisolibacter sp.]